MAETSFVGAGFRAVHLVSIPHSSESPSNSKPNLSFSDGPNNGPSDLLEHRAAESAQKIVGEDEAVPCLPQLVGDLLPLPSW